MEDYSEEKKNQIYKERKHSTKVTDSWLPSRIYHFLVAVVDVVSIAVLSLVDVVSVVVIVDCVLA